MKSGKNADGAMMTKQEKTWRTAAVSSIISNSCVGVLTAMTLRAL